MKPLALLGGSVTTRSLLGHAAEMTVRVEGEVLAGLSRDRGTAAVEAYLAVSDGEQQANAEFLSKAGVASTLFRPATETTGFTSAECWVLRDVDFDIDTDTRKSIVWLGLGGAGREVRTGE